MKYLRFFNNDFEAFGESKTPVVFYLKGAPKPMFASTDKWGETCTIVIDDTEGSAGIKPAGITIIFRDDLGNIISKKEYKSGSTIEIPDAPVKAGYDFLGWGDVEIDKAVANMTFIAQYEVTPKVTINMNDSYTDGSSIALNATKTETVTGELQFTTNLASDIVHIIDNVLIFDKHYEGAINILASALDKHSNIQSDSKTITVYCDVADTVECVISNVTADDVEANATSAIIKYDCNVTTTTHAGVSNTVVAHKEKTVTFEANESEDDVTRSGSFTCEHGETVEWSVTQQGKESTTPTPKNNQIWYKTNNGVVIVPRNMSPTTNTYEDKGVMTFDDNVTSIAQSAFQSKSTLTEFYGGKSLATVGASAFASCSSLTSIDLPKCTNVSDYAFNNCISLTSVNLPKCTTVGNNAFYSCTSLTSIDLPNCTSVGFWAFGYCSSLTSIDLPNCTTVDTCAFGYCSSLTSIDLPNCTSIAGYAFEYCKSLPSVNLPNCTNVGKSAFVGCTSLTSIDLPSCTSVGYGAFQQCTSLTSIDLPNCTSVDTYTFAYCTSLTSIDLPSCTSVSASTFTNCSSLTSIDLPNCTYVGGWAFWMCTSLTSVNLPNCTSVDYFAFYSCTSLTSIDLPSLTSVGVSAFTYCTSLTSVNLPNCTTVGNEAFTFCSRLTSIDLPKCTSVGGGAFKYCTSLSKFTGLMATEDNRCLMSNGTIYAFAPAGLTSYAREDCTTVGNSVFRSCTSLTSIDLPNCTTVGEEAFLGCKSLTSVNLPSCTSVSNYGFYSCTSLTSIDLPSCTTVGNYAFYDCSRLTSIDLPNCTTVGSGAFGGCSSLTTVTLGASTMCNIGNSNAFSNCTSLTSIYVTASLVNTYKADSIWKYYSSKIVPIV